jgi:hypothetical protein
MSSCLDKEEDKGEDSLFLPDKFLLLDSLSRELVYPLILSLEEHLLDWSRMRRPYAVKKTGF